MSVLNLMNFNFKNVVVYLLEISILKVINIERKLTNIFV